MCIPKISEFKKNVFFQVWCTAGQTLKTIWGPSCKVGIKDIYVCRCDKIMSAQDDRMREENLFNGHKTYRQDNYMKDHIFRKK